MRRVGFGAALVLLAAGLVTIGGQQAAVATTTSTLITAADRQSLANSVNGSQFPSGASTAVVAENSVAGVQMAGNYSAIHGLPLVVASSGSTAADVVTRLSALGSTHVVLISAIDNYFTAGFQTSLATASVVQDAYISSVDLFTRWALAAGTASSSYVFARADNADAVLLATSYSVSVGAPLIIFEASTSASSLSSFFASVPSARIIFFDATTSATRYVTDDQAKSMTLVDLSDPRRAFLWITHEAQTVGATINRLHVAASNALDDLAIAGIVAANAHALLAPAGLKAALGTASRATEFLTFWKSGATSVTLIGVGLAGADLTTVAAPTTGSWPAAPLFRVTGVSRAPTSLTLSLSAVSGATSYTAYDPFGATIASASSPGLTFASGFSAALVVAANSGGELARIDVHANLIDLTSNLEGAVVVDANAGTNHLTFIGSVHTPRLIVRSVNDPFGDPAPVFGDATPIALTCSSEWTDVTGDAGKEYVYQVTNLTNVDVQTCGAFPQSPANPALDRLGARVTAPPTEFPCFCKQADAPLRSSVSIAQAAITDALTADTDSAGKFGRSGPGDDWQPIRGRWVAYIPEAKFPFGGTTDPVYPYLMVGGDGHGTNLPNGSVRFSQTVTWTFGSSHSASYSESIGASHGYKCSSTGPGSCVLIDTQTANYNEIGYTLLGHGATFGSASLWASTKNPLLPPEITPAIDTRVSIFISDVNSYVKGYHDNMPKHEFYIGPYPGEYVKVYESPYINWAFNLGCLAAEPNSQIPLCSTTFNAMI